MNNCPRCQSTRLNPNRNRSVKERTIKWFGRRTYRCINCGWRGTLESNHGNIIRWTIGGEQFTPVKVLITIIYSILTVAAILYFITW
jgi:hypothetical protein